MQTVMTVEEIVKEVTLSLSNVFMKKLQEHRGEMLSTGEVTTIYIEALTDTAKAYTHEANEHDTKLH